MSEATNILLSQRKFNVDVNEYLLTVTETQDYKIPEKYNSEYSYDDVESIFKFHLKHPIMSAKYSIDGNPWVSLNKNVNDINYYESRCNSNKNQLVVISPFTYDIYMVRIRLSTKVKMFQIQLTYVSDFDITDHLSFRLPITLVPCYHKLKVTKSDIITSIVENTDQTREKMKLVMNVINESDKSEEEKLVYRDMCIANYKTTLVNNKKTCLYPMYLQQFHKHVDFEPFVSYNIVVDVHVENSNLYLFHAIVNNNLANPTATVPTQLNPGDKYILNTSFGLSGRDDVLFKLYIDNLKSQTFMNGKYFQQIIMPSPINNTTTDESEVKIPTKYIFMVNCSTTMTPYANYLANVILKMCIRYLQEGDVFDIVFIGEEPKKISHKITSSNVHLNTNCMNCNKSPIVGTKYTLKGTSITMCSECHECHKCHTEVDNSSNWLPNDNKTIVRDYEKEIDSQTVSAGENNMYMTCKEIISTLTGHNKLILITDMSISDTDEKKLMKLLFNSTNVDVFAFGVGNGHKESFLDRVCRLKNGCAKHIYDKRDIVYNVNHLMKCVIGKYKKAKLQIIPNTTCLSAMPLDTYFEGETVIVYGNRDVVKEETKEETKEDAKDIVSSFNISLMYDSMNCNRNYTMYTSLIGDGELHNRSYLLLESPLAIPEMSSYETNAIDMSYECKKN